MSSEREWVSGLISKLEDGLNSQLGSDAPVSVSEQYRLAYTNEIERYTDGEPHTCTRAGYETDILVRDVDGQEWVPRVVIETKLNRVTTHDALTYSSKAATHKHVHPYLRYGILIGNWGGGAFPTRLFRHGAYFDFMMTWASLEPAENEWSKWLEVVSAEVVASRRVQQLLTTSRRGSKKIYHLVHRPLYLE